MPRKKNDDRTRTLEAYAERRLRAADRRRAAARRTFAENIDRLLGLHRLTSDWTASLLGVSVTTLSYWRNGHREPDNVAILKRLGDFFEVDPFALLTTPFVELLPTIADPARFESVERRIVEAMYGDTFPAAPNLMTDFRESVEKKPASEGDDLGKRRAAKTRPRR